MVKFPQKASTLLPHEGAMCCIDTLTYCDTKTTTAEVHLRPDHALLDGSTLDRAGFIELAAQTAGLLQGLVLQEKGLPPALGMLVGVQHLEIVTDAKGGDTLCITVIREAELGDVHVLTFSVHCGETLLAQGRLKVYTPV